jgi:hypothetical protein
MVYSQLYTCNSISLKCPLDKICEKYFSVLLKYYYHSYIKLNFIFDNYNMKNGLLYRMRALSMILFYVQ